MICGEFVMSTLSMRLSIREVVWFCLIETRTNSMIISGGGFRFTWLLYETLCILPCS
jgi:hypothetical protein